MIIFLSYWIFCTLYGVTASEETRQFMAVISGIEFAAVAAIGISSMVCYFSERSSK